jgi:Protein of unknown function (DUF1579)
MSQTGSAQKSVDDTHQAAFTRPAPQAEHRWLQKLVGEWTYETEHQGTKATGTERGRSIGDLWVQLEGTGQMPGSSDVTTSIMTLGFDPAKRRFAGTFIASMMTHQWLYDGELDAQNDRLTLTSEGPSMSDEGRMALYRDVIEFQSDDQRTLTASMQQPDGTWQPFMTVSYRRTRRA